MAKSQRRRVAERARHCCEYCKLPQAYTSLPHEIDHVRARKHHGPTSLRNLSWACAACNAAKGPNVAGYDPETDELVPLFNPRQDRWDEHFAWDGPRLLGRMPCAGAQAQLPARPSMSYGSTIHSGSRIERSSLLWDCFPLRNRRLGAPS